VEWAQSGCLPSVGHGWKFGRMSGQVTACVQAALSLLPAGFREGRDRSRRPVGGGAGQSFAREAAGWVLVESPPAVSSVGSGAVVSGSAS
jgi:hypothetical protein